MIILDDILSCPYCFQTWCTFILESDCIILVSQLSVSNSDLIIIFNVILPCPYCFLSRAPILENYCIILVLQLSFCNSDLMIIVDVILPCHYCFHSVHQYWKLLYYSCFTAVFLQLRFYIYI